MLNVPVPRHRAITAAYLPYLSKAVAQYTNVPQVYVQQVAIGARSACRDSRSDL